MNINIGGGKNWNYPGWVNFDQRSFDFKLTPQTVFPVEKAEIVYSSHCFEHLDDETVDQMLREARRLGGALVLKLPDFEEVLKRWRAGDRAYFNQWGMDGVAQLWKNSGVEDTIDSRAAMIFCGWWNEQYGDEWGKRNPDAPGAYHGPVKISPISYAWLFSRTPHDIAASFRYHAPKGAHFNHQNAWSREEMILLLMKHGYEAFSMKADEICQLPIPGIKDQRAISMYFYAR